jgi:hypothetical protein
MVVAPEFVLLFVVIIFKGAWVDKNLFSDCFRRYKRFEGKETEVIRGFQ